MTANGENPGSSRNRATLGWFLQIFILLLLVWTALNGFDGLLAGLAAALSGAAIGSFFAHGQTYPWHPIRGLAFAGFFVLESFKGGSDVAWRALHPALKIQPEFADHSIELPTGLPTTLLVSIVSLLPGTLSVRLFEAEKVLTVHALTPSAIDSVDRLEHMLAWVFSSASDTSQGRR